MEPCSLRPYCGHRFCIQCVSVHLTDRFAKAKQKSCPLCRAKIPEHFAPKIDIYHQKQLKEVYPEIFAEREADLKRAGTLFDREELNFEIGHKYCNLQGRKVSNKYLQAENEFTVFLRMKNKADNEILGVVVDHVKFYVSSPVDQYFQHEAIGTSLSQQSDQHDTVIEFYCNIPFDRLKNESCMDFKLCAYIFFKDRFIPFGLHQGFQYVHDNRRLLAENQTLIMTNIMHHI